MKMPLHYLCVPARKGDIMDFQKIADSFHTPSCVISVQKKEDSYGEIRLVAGNEQYIQPIEHPVIPPGMVRDSFDMPGVPEVFTSTVKFIPNSPYENYLPKDKGFEDICYRAAVLKRPIHTYIHMNDLKLWFNIFALPLGCNDGDTYYCLYSVEPCEPYGAGISSGQSGSAYSEDVIKTCIKLNGTDDLRKTMAEVIQDIRFLCRADGCTIMLFDSDTGKYDVLATSIEEKSNVKRVTQFEKFGNIAATWLEMFGDNQCVILRDKNDMDILHQSNSLWYHNLMEAGVNSIVLFPLKYDNEVLGFMWATNFDTNNTMRIKETLELTTFFISSKLSTYKMVEHLRDLSYNDSLTGIPNRLACTEKITELINNGAPFALVSADINNFKSINEAMGFNAGNEALIEIASRWKTLAVKGGDHLARMAGDEFMMTISGYSTEDELLKKIQEYEAVLNEHMTIDNCDLCVNASFGYALYPDDAATRDNLISCANASMSEIKHRRSSEHILRFSEGMMRTQRSLELERMLLKALENDTMYYALQPQFDISHKLRGFEALARMKDDKGNNISPAEFVPAAERAGLVDKVDGTVFRKSAMFIGDLIRRTGADITLSVNVSVRHLMKNDFLNEVRSVLDSSGLSPTQLEIEITESIMIDSVDKALRCIDDLHSMGIKIAIDDFGTGYSSLSYLNKFPADILKVDKSFIDKMNTSDSSKQYVAAIISIGHIMGFRVISEGVEEEQQLDTLAEIGCDYIQGYIWGKPMPQEAAGELVISQYGK